jgi:hypothetical protein
MHTLSKHTALSQGIPVVRTVNTFGIANPRC